MTQELNKLIKLLGDPLDSPQVHKWFSDTIPYFGDNPELFGENKDFDISQIYSGTVENETRLLIWSFSGSAAPLIKATKSDTWSKRVLEVLLTLHIFPIKLASKHQNLRIELFAHDYRDSAYLEFKKKDFGPLMKNFQEKDKNLTRDLFYEVVGQLDQIRYQYEIEMIMIAMGLYADSYLIDKILRHRAFKNSDILFAILAAIEADRLEEVVTLFGHYKDETPKSITAILKTLDSLKNPNTDRISMFVAERYAFGSTKWLIWRICTEHSLLNFVKTFLDARSWPARPGYVLPGINEHTDGLGQFLFARFEQIDYKRLEHTETFYLSNTNYFTEVLWVSDSDAELYKSDLTSLPAVMSYVMQHTYYYIGEDEKVYGYFGGKSIFDHRGHDLISQDVLHTRETTLLLQDNRTMITRSIMLPLKYAIIAYGTFLGRN